MDGGQRQAPALPWVSHLAPVGRTVHLRRIPLQPGRREIQRPACPTEYDGPGECPSPPGSRHGAGPELGCHRPGDELVADPASVATRAVTVEAPPEEVWRWLVQIGQDRGGMYSYDGLENVLGLRIHSTDRIREEWQRLDAGDRVRLVPKGWLGLPEGLALSVARVDPGRSIVLREQPPQQPWDAVWSFHVRPLGQNR